MLVEDGRTRRCPGRPASFRRAAESVRLSSKFIEPLWNINDLL